MRESAGAGPKVRGTLPLGIPYLVAAGGDQMLVMGRGGWLDAQGVGLYARDTRYLSRYRLLLDGRPPRHLGADQPQPARIILQYTNPALPGPSPVPPSTLALRLERIVRGGLREQVTLTNHAPRRVRLRFALELEADFADIFEVRGLRTALQRQPDADWDPGQGLLTFAYSSGDFARRLRLALTSSSGPPSGDPRTLAYDLDLAPGESWRAEHRFAFDGEPFPGEVAVLAPALDTEARAWRERFAGVETPAFAVKRACEQAVLDLAELNLPDVEGRAFPAAGLPWYGAVFGRDSLLTALETLPFARVFVEGVLARLEALQGLRVNPATEEEPGKIPHELRRGELAATGLIPYGPYYGTVDASPLYAVLLHEAYRHTGSLDLVERFYPAAARCLGWARDYGDIDGDGFVEYHAFTSQSYSNQGWKDSDDAVVYPDGTPVAPPIALCEVQGYYYAALRGIAALARALARVDEAEEYDRRAETLLVRLDEAFWLPEARTFAFALDSQKRPLAVPASNVGHLLWSRAVRLERSASVAAALLGADLFSGWGVRTLGASSLAYNPVSYHRGTVWPHDNAIVALGLKRYGHWRAANRLAEAIFAVAARYERHSLPEVFAGLARADGGAPVPYAETCLPQAWAAGSVFMLLQAILGLEPDPRARVLRVTPTLPEWLPELELRQLPVFDGTLDLRFWGSGEDSRVEVLRRQGDGAVEHVRLSRPRALPGTG